MDRRTFLKGVAVGVAGLGFGLDPSLSAARRNKGYSIVILGDTHYDAEPSDIYHSNYDEKTEWLNRVQREEFRRNGEMWRERCPRLLHRAAGLIDNNTRMAFQMGDLIQGDCGNGEVHRKMLDDVLSRFKSELGGLPLITVVGNHDIRGVDAERVYREYMPERMSQELGRPVTGTCFDFAIQDDAFIFIDFESPDDALIDSILDRTKGARNTFIVSHSPIIPADCNSCRWFFHGGYSDYHTQARRHFLAEFARRNAIVLCGHIHTTDYMDWGSPEGRITQMTMNSVWERPEQSKYILRSQGADQYGTLRAKMKTSANGNPLTDESALFDEYRSGIREYSSSSAAGSYKLNVFDRGVTIDFYAGDSRSLTHTFVLR